MRRRPRGRRPSRLAVFAAAKVNLGWRVGDRRPDGFHEVAGLVQTVSLHDALELRLGDDVTGDVVVDVGGVPLGLRVVGAEADAALATADNLVFRAAEVAASRAEATPVSIVLDKRIPVAAGLGGGSADAAGVLFGLAMAWGSDLTARELVGLGARIGSDVPALLLGGLVHASGRGEVVRQVGCASGTRFVIGVSEARLSTAEVYERSDELRPAETSRTEGVFVNDLEAAAIDLEPRLGEGLEAMRRAGAVAAFVAGSGPSVVGVVAEPGDATAVAARVERAFRRVVVADATSWGVRLGFGASLSG